MLIKIFNTISVGIGILAVVGSIMAWTISMVTGELEFLGATFYSTIILINGLLLALFIYAYGFMIKNIQETNENTNRIYKILSQKIDE